jgi:hypothetical protein
MPEKRATKRLTIAITGVIFGALACSALAACRGSGEARKPTAALSPKVDADVEMRRLLASWARGSAAERQAMEPALATFRQHHEKDPLARLAEVLLAWIALDKGILDVAEVRARTIRKAVGPGTVGDVAQTVEGAAMRRQGRPGEALELLSPLVSKLIDPWSRALFNQEIVDAAVEAGRWDRALELMRVWLREAASDERATARAHVERSLDKVPPFALLKALDRSVELALSAEDELDLRKLLTARLAVVARATKDAALAQHLLTIAGGMLGDQGDAIASLAAGASKARVEARTVGLLVSLRNDKTRRRGADIAEGVAFGLGLPGSAARLVSRDDHGSAERLEEALAALSAEGASIVIAGSDEQEATTAAVFAETHRIPVILLRAPAASALSASAARYTFVMGIDPAAMENTLVGALTSRGASPIAVLADEPIRARAPRPEIAAVRGCSQAGASWKALGVGGVLLAAQPECAREAIAAAAPLKLKFAAGFEGSDGVVLPAGSVTATAGIFPVEGQSLSALKGWLKDHPSPPSFWTALGRDAAVLAWAGVQALPAQGTEDPAEVEARRAWAAQALAGAQAELWTTEAKGFGGGRVLGRTIGVREVK